MSLFRSRLFSGALYAGRLWGVARNAGAAVTGDAVSKQAQTVIAVSALDFVTGNSDTAQNQTAAGQQEVAAHEPISLPAPRRSRRIQAPVYEQITAAQISIIGSVVTLQESDTKAIANVSIAGYAQTAQQAGLLVCEAIADRSAVNQKKRKLLTALLLIDD